MTALREKTQSSPLPLPIPDYVSILLDAVTARLKVRHPLTRGFETDFRRAFAEAAHAIGVYHHAEPTKYNYFYGKVWERVEGELATIREQSHKPLRPIATSRQIKLPFDGPSQEQYESPPPGLSLLH